MANAPHVSLKREHDVLRRIAKVYVEDDLERKEHKFNIARAFVPLAILVAVRIHAWGLMSGFTQSVFSATITDVHLSFRVDQA